MAHEAWNVGGAPAAESYLNIASILDVAKQAGADFVHPGYGFLSENAEFAEVCESVGLTFVGPAPEHIRRMGDKAQAKKLMRERKHEEALSIYLALAEDEKVTPRQESFALEQAAKCARLLKDEDLAEKLEKRLSE